MLSDLLLSLLRRFGIQIVVMAAIVGSGWWLLNRAEQRGWDRRDDQAQVEAAEAERNAGTILLENVADAAERDRIANDKIDALNAAAHTRAGTLSEHLAAQERTQPPTPTQGATHGPVRPSEPAFAAADVPRPLLGHSVLDAFTVGVLNDARRNAPGPTPGGAAPGADAEGQAAASAPTNITGRLFADNDLEVVRLYHELATRHDGLVDWVNHQCVPEKPQPTAP
jgi:hypothetical protein